MSYGKCWYSESLDPQSFFDVDHYRPKLEARRSNDVTYPGYEWLVAVAQKSPCEGNRVIMGKTSPLKLGQRGQDAGQEVPMRTPKQLYAEERIIYRPELLTCLHCGDLLVTWNYLA